MSLPAFRDEELANVQTVCQKKHGHRLGLLSVTAASELDVKTTFVFRDRLMELHGEEASRGPSCECLGVPAARHRSSTVAAETGLEVVM